MRILIFIYYLSFLISGGFRNYYDELCLQEACQNLHIHPFLKSYIFVTEYVLQSLSLLILLFPLKKLLHLSFFLLLFLNDLYFQNFILFEYYIILIHLFPLIVYLYLHYQNHTSTQESVKKGIILTIAVGFITALIGKIQSGWLDPRQPVLYSYFLLTDKSYNIHPILADAFYSIKHFYIYKALDYVIVVFQFFFFYLLFNVKFFRWFAPIAVIFHLLIMLILDISLFYVYILVYTIPFLGSNKIEKKSPLTYKIISISIVVLYVIWFIASGFHLRCILEYSDIKLYLGYSYLITIISTLVFIKFWKAYTSKDAG